MQGMGARKGTRKPDLARVPATQNKGERKVVDTVDDVAQQKAVLLRAGSGVRPDG